ncbi:MAG: HAD-IIB family hydrolase [Ferruginibacter sp.]
MNGIYIQLFSPHGLIRHLHPEIGKDKDTGGQVKYVLELLEALSAHKEVRKVDLFTRRIADKRVAATYAEPIEHVTEKARIIRISCGGSTYRRKENLWDHLDEFTDKTIHFIEQEDDYPDIVHGHYADGNYIAQQLAKIYGIPFFSTGHSLGRNKKKILLAQGLTEEKLNSSLKIDYRIQVEESVIRHADQIIASTRHEIETQYGLYDAARQSRFTVIPPGINSKLFYPYYRITMPTFRMTIEQEQALNRLNEEIERFLFSPVKPLIVSIGRPDKRKNFETIIQAFGEDKELQTMANLAIFAGVRKDISVMPEEEQEILTGLLLLMDKYNLYGKMAIPKKNDPQREVPEIYRIAASRKGVFVNATPGENFGLTIIEAAASGLPVIASPTGGPREILQKCRNGLLVNVEDPAILSAAIKKIISNNELWQQLSNTGVIEADNTYSWKAHTQKYISLIQKTIAEKKKQSAEIARSAYGKKMAGINHFLISDIDGTLVDEKKTLGLKQLSQWIHSHANEVTFGLASGRNRELVKKAVEHYKFPQPDILICSAGSEIYYTTRFEPDMGWENHISHQWKRKEIEELLQRSEKLKLQESIAQREFKLSYYVDKDFSEEDLNAVYRLLYEKKLRAKMLLTENRFLDILPFRASKGNAIRYLSNKWKTPLENFMTAGNSGNDIDMLTGRVKGIVVGNYSAELEPLKKLKDVYFARNILSRGVLEGIRHYQFP